MDEANKPIDEARAPMDETEEEVRDGDPDLTMEELAALALAEMAERATGKPAWSKSEPNSPPPQIPDWLLDL